MAKEAAHVFYANFLSGIDIPGETRPEWTDSHRCMQGRWIDGDGEKIYGRTQEFRSYRQAHEHLHDLVREALATRDRGETERFAILKEEIRLTNQSLIQYIEHLQNMGVLATAKSSPEIPQQDAPLTT